MNEIMKWKIVFKRILLIIKANKKKKILINKGWNSWYSSYEIKENDILGKTSRRRICCEEKMTSLKQGGRITVQWYCYKCHKLAINSIAEI